MEVNELHRRGQRLYRRNQHLRRLANVMEHPEFRQFYDTYLQDWHNAKAMLIFMKLYEAVEKRSERPLTPYQKLAVVQELYDNSYLREQICQSNQLWLEKTHHNDSWSHIPAKFQLEHSP